MSSLLVKGEDEAHGGDCQNGGFARLYACKTFGAGQDNIARSIFVQVGGGVYSVLEELKQHGMLL
ncbi:MAG: hypothetical protein IPL35_15010 [Sphingobacteriales bacterium]|nr:hypothetical protein [Sphingobacteriales bacterium]